jgi:DUF4097 and DUF4098 domain-containing protein YvlB
VLRSLLRPRVEPGPDEPAAAVAPQASASMVRTIQVRTVDAHLVLTSSPRHDVYTEGPVIVSETADGVFSVSERRPANEPHPICRVNVPLGCVLDVQMETGSLVVFQFNGTLRARLRFGSVKMNHIQGRLRIVTGTGAVEVDNLRGGLDVLSGSGHVTARTVAGDLQVVSDSGGIDLSGIDGPVAARSITGGIRAEGLTATARLGTRTGPITIERAMRQLTARSQAGDLSWTGSVLDHTTLETFKGRVEVKLGPGTDARIQATARQGVVRTERLALSPGSGRKSIRATLGSGKARLRLSTGLGVIEITAPRPSINKDHL